MFILNNKTENKKSVLTNKMLIKTFKQLKDTKYIAEDRRFINESLKKLGLLNV